MIKLDLQHFADGGAAGAGGNGGGAPMATGNDGAASPQHMQQPNQMQQSQGEQQPGFRDLIKDPRYKQEAETWLKGAMDQRFRGHKQQLDQLQSQSQAVQPILGLVAQKYGLEAGDIEGIQKALEADDSIYAERAAQAGMPVKAFKKLDQLERENQNFKAQKQKEQQDAAIAAHLQSLRQQEAELKQQFPGFDLNAELSNPQFRAMTAPGSGIPVKNAYFALHADEIQRQGMQYAGQQAAQAVAASVRSGALRPQENVNGMNAITGMRIDPSQMSDEQLEEISRRARNGERITFR